MESWLCYIRNLGGTSCFFPKSLPVSSTSLFFNTLLNDYFLLYSHDENRLYSQIQAGAYNTTCAEWLRVSDNARKFVKDLLHVKPTKRLCCEEALEHSWIKSLLTVDSTTGERTLVIFIHSYHLLLLCSDSYILQCILSLV